MRLKAIYQNYLNKSRSTLQMLSIFLLICRVDNNELSQEDLKNYIQEFSQDKGLFEKLTQTAKVKEIPFSSLYSKV